MVEEITCLLRVFINIENFLLWENGRTVVANEKYCKTYSSNKGKSFFFNAEAHSHALSSSASQMSHDRQCHVTGHVTRQENKPALRDYATK